MAPSRHREDDARRVPELLPRIPVFRSTELHRRESRSPRTRTTTTKRATSFMEQQPRRRGAELFGWCNMKNTVIPVVGALIIDRTGGEHRPEPRRDGHLTRSTSSAPRERSTPRRWRRRARGGFQRRQAWRACRGPRRPRWSDEARGRAVHQRADAERTIIRRVGGHLDTLPYSRHNMTAS